MVPQRIPTRLDARLDNRLVRGDNARHMLIMVLEPKLANLLLT
jgi:hypothetical protein